MQKQSVNLEAQIPDLNDFGERFPQYGPFARNEGNFIFNTIMNPFSFFRARFATEMNLPAVSGIAEICFHETTQQNIIPFNGFLKQYIGALVCSLMEANGYSKTGTKKAIPHHAFTKGEFYQ
jgi:hypothetical protein